MTYRLWVNDERTILIRMWSNGEVEISTRETSEHTWGPPIRMIEEPVQ